MRNIGDEVAAGLLDALGFSEIAKNGNNAAVGKRRGGDVEGAAGDNGGGTPGLHVFGIRGGFDGGKEIGIANGLDDGSVEASTLGDHAVHRLVGPADEAFGADG